MNTINVWSEKFCTKCQIVTKWNTHDRCLACQRNRSKRDYLRRKAAGGSFANVVKKRLIAEHPKRCPKCKRLWTDIPKHMQHPNTPWHFDHIVSPQKGGLSTADNAAILCWQCNLKKLNR